MYCTCTSATIFDKNNIIRIEFRIFASDELIDVPHTMDKELTSGDAEYLFYFLFSAVRKTIYNFINMSMPAYYTMSYHRVS